MRDHDHDNNYKKKKRWEITIGMPMSASVTAQNCSIRNLPSRQCEKAQLDHEIDHEYHHRL
jgi:hypothetical protein